MAKYRWICNKPGLVLTGRWNLQHRTDLSIYHGTAYNEDPAEIWFNDLQSVEDVADASTADIGVVERSNFVVDAKAIENQLIALLNESAARDQRRS